MGARIPSSDLWRGVAAAVACALLGLVAFGRGERVMFANW